VIEISSSGAPGCRACLLARLSAGLFLALDKVRDMRKSEMGIPINSLEIKMRDILEARRGKRGRKHRR